jgi:hypothetical protein
MPIQVQPILACKPAGASNPQLGFLDGSGAAPTFFGATFSTPETAAKLNHENLCKRFKGFAFSIVGNKVWKSNGSTTPTAVYTFAQAMANPFDHLGLYIVQVAGVPTLTAVYYSQAQQRFYLARSTDGSSFTETTVSGLSPSVAGPFGRTGVFRNTVHFTNGTTTIGIDLIAATGAIYNSAANQMDGNRGNDFCAYKGIFYRLGLDVSGGFWALWALNGAIWQRQYVLNFRPSANQAPSTNKDTLLFADGAGNLIALVLWEGNFITGVHAYKIVADASGAITSSTNISSTILPASWLPIDGGPNTFGANGTKMWCYQELDSISGQVSTHLFVCPVGNEGNPISYYQYHDAATQIGLAGVANDSGGDASFALPHTKAADFTTGTNNIWDATYIEVFYLGSPSAQLNGEEDQFAIYNVGLSATPLRNVKSFFTKTGEMENQTPVHFLSCRKVSGPGVAPTLSNDKLTIQGCSGDGTVYAGTWDIVTDGVVALDRVSTVLQAD